MKLKLYDSIENKSWLLDVKDAGSTMNYYKFNINLPNDINDGCKIYTLLDDNNNEISNGLLQIGDYKQNNKQYSDKKQNIVYNG